MQLRVVVGKCIPLHVDSVKPVGGNARIHEVDEREASVRHATPISAHALHIFSYDITFIIYNMLFSN